MALASQTNYQTAVAQGAKRLQASPPEVLAALGARVTADGYCTLPVLDAVFAVDLASGRVTLATPEHEPLADREVGLKWQILALHYLAGPIPLGEPARWVSFADLPDGRGYERVYQARVVSRLCKTAARERAAFVRASEGLGGQRAVWGDEGFRFQAFPCLSVIIAWYQGDEELPANASFVYPDDILSLLPVEDVIVLSEGVVSRLQGKDW